MEKTKNISLNGTRWTLTSYYWSSNETRIQANDAII